MWFIEFKGLKNLERIHSGHEPPPTTSLGQSRPAVGKDGPLVVERPNGDVF